MILLRDLPGIDKIEARSTTNDLTGCRQDHELDSWVETFRRTVLGIDLANDVTEAIEITDAVEGFRQAGWDLTDGKGQPLRCLPLITTWLALVEIGIGKPKLQIEAEAWARKAA